MQDFEADFAEDREHHYEEADGNWEGYSDELAALEGWAGGGDELAEEDADCHCEDDPDDEEAVQEGEAAEGRDVRGDGAAILGMLELEDCRALVLTGDIPGLMGASRSRLLVSLPWFSVGVGS